MPPCMGGMGVNWVVSWEQVQGGLQSARSTWHLLRNIKPHSCSLACFMAWILNGINARCSVTACLEALSTRTPHWIWTWEIFHFPLKAVTTRVVAWSLHHILKLSKRSKAKQNRIVCFWSHQPQTFDQQASLIFIIVINFFFSKATNTSFTLSLPWHYGLNH